MMSTISGEELGNNKNNSFHTHLAYRQLDSCQFYLFDSLRVSRRFTKDTIFRDRGWVSIHI